jgi:hypothetical protein
VKILCGTSLGFLIMLLCGCGSTTKRTATEQLLTSDAVDMAVSQIDFRPLGGQDVYLDTQYLKNIKGIGFTNAEYIISSLRQQMVGAGCLLQDDKDSATYIVEARIGALGTDDHDIVYGLPASNAISTAASAVSGMPSIPTIPEISFARKNDQSAAAKIAVFAYHNESRERVWQSGIAVSKRTAKDTWILGAGPFQSGTVYDGIQFAGSELELRTSDESDPTRPLLSNYRESTLFSPPALPEDKQLVAEEAPDEGGGVVPASAEQVAPSDSE